VIVYDNTLTVLDILINKLSLVYCYHCDKRIAMRNYLLVALLFFIVNNNAFAQTNNSSPSYPQIKGFVSVIHPIVTFDKNGSTYNFSKGSYTVGFPMAIMIFKSDKIGYTFEVAPIINSANGTSKVSNVVFDPGIIFRRKHGYNFIMRTAFETGGRYGFTPVLAKTIIKRPNVNYFVDVAAPVRFGNEKPASIGFSFQFGIVF